MIYSRTDVIVLCLQCYCITSTTRVAISHHQVPCFPPHSLDGLNSQFPGIFTYFGLGPHLRVLRSYFWLWNQESHLTLYMGWSYARKTTLYFCPSQLFILTIIIVEHLDLILLNLMVLRCKVTIFSPSPKYPKLSINDLCNFYSLSSLSP